MFERGEVGGIFHRATRKKFKNTIYIIIIINTDMNSKNYNDHTILKGWRQWGEICEKSKSLSTTK